MNTHGINRGTKAIACWFMAVAVLAAGLLVVTPRTAGAAPAKAPSRSSSPSRGLSPGAAATQAEQSGSPVEVSSVTTATQQTFANPDGTLTVTSSARPVRVRRNGGWVNLDATLHANPDGSLSPVASTSGLVVSGGGTSAMATMTNLGAQLAVSWPGPLPTPTVSGPTATYANILPGVDLQVTATEQGGFSQVLIVHDATAAANPALATLHLPITANGVSVAADAQGRLAATTATGAVAFSAPQALMWDAGTAAAASQGSAKAPAAAGPSPSGSAEPSSTATDPGADAHVAVVQVQADNSQLTLTPDHDMLTSTTTQWPVFIDPSWNPNSAAGSRSNWTYVASAWPDQSYWNTGDDARIGYSYDSPHYVARSFFQLGIPSQIWGTKIIKAMFQTSEVWTASTTAAPTVEVHHMCGISASTTWNSQPCKGNIVASRQIPADWSPGGAHNPIEEDFDITSEITSAAAGRWSSDTLGLYNTNESSTDGWKKFANNPTIAITYNSLPNKPTNLTTNPSTHCNGDGQGNYDQVGNTAVTLSATMSDPDGTQTQIEADFTITDQTTNTTLSHPTVTVSNHQTAFITLAAATLTDGHTYAWSVQAYDGHDHSGTAGPCRFDINHQQPDPPGVTSTDYPENQVSGAARTAGNFTFAGSGSGETPDGFVYAFNVQPTLVAGHASASLGGTYVKAVDGSITRSLTPPRVGPNTLYVYAVDTAGNPSSTPYAYQFSTPALATPDPAGDLTGDGKPDLIQPGTTHPGLWLYPATDTNGHLNARGTQIGAAGTGINTPGAASDWNATTETTADFNADGSQDILVTLPTPASDGSNTEVIYAYGDGDPLGTTATDILPLPLPAVDGSNSAQTVDQIAPTPDPVTPFPDLYVVVGDSLWLYTPGWTPGAYADNPECLSGPAGSGCDTLGDWSTQTITGTSTTTGPALFARNITTGELDMWTGNTDKQIPAAGIDSTKTIYATSGWATTSTTMINADDINHDSQPDVWATTNNGHLTARINTGNNTLATAVDNGPPIFTTVSKDLNGDGKADVIARDSDGLLWLYPGTGGNGTNTLGSKIQVGTGWNGMISINIGDIDGDGKTDVLAADTSGILWLYPGTGGNGTNTLGSKIQVGTGWNAYTVSLGDVNGDGRTDIIARDHDGVLWLYPNTGNTGIHTFASPTEVGWGWNIMTSINVADVNNDSLVDIIARTTDGTLELYPNTGGTGTNTFALPTQVGNGWNTITSITLADLTNDGKPDIIARDSSANLQLYANTGGAATNTFATPIEIGTGWGAMTIAA